MLRIIEYSVFFIAVILLQVFLFENLNLGIYIHPLVYIGFILLLPMEIPAVTILMLGLGTGILMDVSTGSGGLHTIATVFTAFSRPYLMPLLIGREEVKEGGVPVPARLGYGKFFRFSAIVVFLHCLLFFTFESMSWNYFHFTLIRIIASSIVTVVLVFFAQMVIPEARDKSQTFPRK